MSFKPNLFLKNKVFVFGKIFNLIYVTIFLIFWFIDVNYNYLRSQNVNMLTNVTLFFVRISKN